METGETRRNRRIVESKYQGRQIPPMCGGKRLPIKGLTETLKPDIINSISQNRLDELERFFGEEINPELRTASISMLNSLGYFDRDGGLEIKAKSVVANSELDPAYRMDAIKVLSLSDPDQYSDLFQRLISTEEQEDLRMACILALAQTTGNRNVIICLGYGKI